jgi:hypothetical protein
MDLERLRSVLGPTPQPPVEATQKADAAAKFSYYDIMLKLTV